MAMTYDENSTESVVGWECAPWKGEWEAFYDLMVNAVTNAFMLHVELMTAEERRGWHEAEYHSERAEREATQ